MINKIQFEFILQNSTAEELTEYMSMINDERCPRRAVLEKSFKSLLAKIEHEGFSLVYEGKFLNINKISIE